MSCCGKGRVAVGGRAAPPNMRMPLQPRPTVMIEYIGETSMAVLGPITGTRYFFDAKGAQAAVDLRDRPYLLTIPTLRQAGHTSS